MAEHFFVYGKPGCKFCVKAMTILNREDKSYSYFTLGVHFTREELLENFPDAKTFPQIIVLNSGHETYIGGYTELEKYIDDNFSS